MFVDLLMKVDLSLPCVDLTLEPLIFCNHYAFLGVAMPALVGLDLPVTIGFVIPLGPPSCLGTLVSRMMRLAWCSFVFSVGN